MLMMVSLSCRSGMIVNLSQNANVSGQATRGNIQCHCANWQSAGRFLGADGVIVSK